MRVTVLSLAAALGFIVPAAAQTPPGMSQAQMQLCIRLEAELARVDQPVMTTPDLQRNYDEAIAKQQFELDRTLAQTRRMNCERPTGFFIFGAPERPVQCDTLDRQVDRMRQNLDRMMAEAGRVRGPQGSDREFQRRQVLAALAQNNCGPQYNTGPVRTARSGNFFEMLFGGFRETFDPADNPASVNTFRTLCVRTCDGFYFPISFSATPMKFPEDERICRAQCPGSEVVLFTHRNPGEDVSQAISTGGQPYSKLPNAFKYRQAFDSSCACKSAGQTWAQAIGHLDGTLQQGDIVVTEERSKAMRQVKLTPPPKPAAAPQPLRANASRRGADPVTLLPPPPEPPPLAPELRGVTPAVGAPGERKVRAVGPVFYPVR